MIDTHLATLIAAGDAMSAALRNLPCRCAHNVPYADCNVERKVTTVCARCVSMVQWDEAKNKTNEARSESSNRVT